MFCAGPILCGNAVLDEGEQCDSTDFESCRSCVRQQGFMCANSSRNVYSPHRAEMEFCAEVEPFFLWDPALYASMVGDNASWPAAGLYTASTCQEFEIPQHYAMQNCALEAKDICLWSEDALCPSSVCESVSGSYRCLCPLHAFPLNREKTLCTEYGIEMHVVFDDTASYVNTTAVQSCASVILTSLRPDGYVNTDDVEAVEWTVEKLGISVHLRQWKMSFRLPLQWVDVDLISSKYETLVVNVSAAVSTCGMQMSTISFNDVAYEATNTPSNGLEIRSYEWLIGDPRGLGWAITIRIPVHEGTRRVIYVSKRSTDNTLLAANDGDIPCPFYEGAEKCCMQRFSDLVHLPVSMAPFLSCTHGEALSGLPILSANGLLTGAANASSFVSYATTADGRAIDVDLFLSYEAVKTKYATEIVNLGISKFSWFVGVAQIRVSGNMTAVHAAHAYFNAHVTSTYTLTTNSVVQKVAAPLLNIEMIRVQDTEKSWFYDFVRVRATLTDPDLQFVATDTVPVTSAMFKIQYALSSGTAQYMCHGYDRQPFELFQSTHPCSLQDTPCEPSFDESMRSTTLVFPLGIDAFTPTLQAYDSQTLGLTQQLHLDFFLRLKNHDKVILERIQTSSEILRRVLIVQCSAVQSDVSLGSLITMNMIGGLLGNESDLNTTVSFFTNVSNPTSNEVCDEYNPRSICMKTPQIGLGSMTYILLGNENLFSSKSGSEYHVRISSMFSIYFLSELKKIAVRNLLRSGRAFVLPAGQTLENTVQLVPSEELLTLCPLHFVPDNLGCISRFEIEDSVMDFETTALTAISMPYDSNATAAQNKTLSTLDSWVSAGAFGGSQFMQQTVQNHAELVVSLFGINSRYRTALLQSPALPWTPSALKAVNITTRIDAVQDTFSFILVTMDSSRNNFREPSYSVLRISSRAPVSCSIFSSHPYLQDAFLDVLVAILGGSRHLFSIESNFENIDTECFFTVLFQLPHQVQARSLVQGKKMALALNNPYSPVSQVLSKALRAEFLQIQARVGVDMPRINQTDFRGLNQTVAVPYSSAQAPSRRRRARLLLTVNDEPVQIETLTRNESVFASEISSRRYKDINSADKMAEIVEERITQDGTATSIRNGTSRLAMLELLVPKSIACEANESRSMELMQEYLREALQKSTTTQVAAVTPTSFVTLDSTECAGIASPSRRLLQSQPVTFFRSRTEIVFTPTAVEESQKREQIIVHPTTILRNLPGNLQLVRIQAAPSSNKNAIGVAASWGDGEMPPLPPIPVVHTVIIPPSNEPTYLIRAFHTSVIASLVLAVINLLFAIFQLGGNTGAFDFQKDSYTPVQSYVHDYDKLGDAHVVGQGQWQSTESQDIYSGNPP